MHVILAKGVNDAYRSGLRHLAEHHITRGSRNGPVLVCREPVTTRYSQPQQRVLLDPQRDANPFFHLFESLWMLAGRRDLAFLTRFLPRFGAYSDDGVTVNGSAYGWRWRNHWSFDQLDMAVQLLQQDPDSRRAVLGMWDPEIDLGSESRDVPCNDLIKLALEPRTGGYALNMVVFNRSNDVVWGAYGANMVHFSMLQEYLAARLHTAVGWHEQVSCDFHAYQTTWDKVWPVAARNEDPYNHLVQSVPLVGAHPSFDVALPKFLAELEARDTLNSLRPYEEQPFLRDVAFPMWMAHVLHRRNKSTQTAFEYLSDLTAAHSVDWLVAGREWLQRRLP